MSRARDLADGALYKIAPSTSGNVLASDGSGNWVSDGAVNTLNSTVTTLTTTVGTKVTAGKSIALAMIFGG